MKYVNYSATPSPATDAITDSNATVDNIRILDPNIISPTFVQTQKIALPYTFSNSLNVDRYTLDKQLHDYIVAVREQAPGSNLRGNQNNWINQHTVYTHGYGFVAARADQDITTGSTSDYTEGDIPPVGPLPQKQARGLLRSARQRLRRGGRQGAAARVQRQPEQDHLPRRRWRPALQPADQAGARAALQGDQLPAQLRGVGAGRAD